MRLSDIGEFGFISRIAGLVTHRSPALTAGIGDDAAVLDPGDGYSILLSTDAMVEGRHFRRRWMHPRRIGGRAAAAALSDIAAMGGEALAILCTICIDPHWLVEDAEELFAGMQALAERFGAGLAGGDIVSAPGPLLVDITAIGRAVASEVWYRGGARPGDRLLITGCMGDAAAAVDLLESEDAISIDCFPRLHRALVEPSPRLDVAAALAGDHAVHAAIDTSDGLMQDAGHIAEASGVGIAVNAADIPVSGELIDCARLLGRDPLTWAAAGGEDYQLLLAVDHTLVDGLCGRALERGLHLIDIGQVLSGVGVSLLDESGNALDVKLGGWDHFGR